jgi:hypothetical protein|nr:MAG TPA: hypothetical protein [Caudoviricetes sp.]
MAEATNNDVVKDTDADTRDDLDATKTDEEQEVRDTDADTRDDIDATKRAQDDINRKLTSMGEAIANLTKVVTTLVKSGPAASADTGFASTNDAGKATVKPITDLDI